MTNSKNGRWLALLLLVLLLPSFESYSQCLVAQGPTDQTVCAGSSVTLTCVGGLFRQWKRNGVNIPGATGLSYTINPVTVADNGAVYTVLFTCALGTQLSAPGTLTVNSLISITAQPLTQTICQGNSTTFSITATGGSLSYQWRKNGVNIGGATASSYTIASTVVGSAGIYSVVITNTCGSLTSSDAVLSVSTPPTINTHPASATRCVGTSVTFTTSATGTSLSYQWQKNGGNIGTNSTSYTIASPVTGDAGNYTVIITSGACSVTSNTAALTVNTLPAITVQPVASQTLCAGVNASFSVTATGTGLSYQWKRGVTNVGTNSNSLTVNNIGAGDAGTYTVVVSGSCSPSVTSNNSVLTVNALPAITVQPVVSQTLCAGVNAGFSVTATGTGLSYQWKRGVTNVGTNSNSLTVNNIGTGDAGIYTVVVSGTCTPSVTSNNSLLIVNPLPAISVHPLPQTICAGLPIAFSVTASGAGIGYQWKKDGINIGGANSSSLNIASASGSDAGSYSVEINGSCTPAVTSSTANLIVNTTNVWSGVGSSWSTGGNWSCGAIPTSALDVTIPTGVSFYPVVPAGATANVRNLTISNGATLTLNSSTSTMQVYGDWTNNGSFVPNTGTIAFNGTSAQNIAGSTTTDFYNLTVNNTAAAVSLGQDVNIQGTLTLGANSTFTTTGYDFTLKSNASGTARIGAVPASATINGDISMQRYIPAKGGRYWYQLASPVTGTMAGHWQQAFAITGNFWGASTPGNGINPAGTSMYTWGAGTGLWERFPDNSNGEFVVAGIGYRAFVRDGNASYNGGATTAKTFTSVGTPTVGNFNFTLPYNPVGGTPAGGWNLIGNPYPSNINGDLNNAAWTSKTNLDGFAIYMWDSDAQSYVSCNGGIGSCIVPSSQAFWVKVNPGGGSLTASENVKSTGSLTIYKLASLEPNYIPVKMINGASGESDVLYLRFEADATEQFDQQYDAYKLIMSASGVVNNSVSLYSQIDAVNYSIMARPVPAVNDTIPLTIAGPVGEHLLDFSDNSHLESHYQYLLIDKFENTITDLVAAKTYNFSITSDVTTYQNRFFVVFKLQEEESGQSIAGATDATESMDINVYPNPVISETIQISLPETAAEDIRISIIDMKGIEVYSEKTIKASTLSIPFGKKYKAGAYIVLVQAGDKQYRKKIVVQ